MNNSNNGAMGQQQPPISNQPTGGIQLPGMASAIEHYRLSQLYQYAMAAERLRGPPGSQSSLQSAASFFPPIPTGLRPELAPFLYSSYCRIDPRLALCRPPDEPKPQHSYIGLIAMAILGSPDKKLVLSDIYQYILDNYPYFRSRGPGWRNSIRHNLSLNDCFVKSGRSANGKGHYWAIHPANIDDFTKGDFRRRKAQRKVRRHMGLAVDDPDSPSPPPVSPPPVNWPDHPHLNHHHPLLHPHPPPGHHRQFPHPHFALLNPNAFPAIGGSNTGPNFEFANSLIGRGRGPELLVNSTLTLNMNFNQLHRERKRQFDVASLLAPENDILTKAPTRGQPVSPASTSKSVKSDEDCEIEQCFSRTPSPISPMCKTPKKMSPTNSEEEQVSDDEEKGGRKQAPSAKNSSDEDEETGSVGRCSGNFSAKNMGAFSSPRGFVGLNGESSPDKSPPPGGIQFRDERRTNNMTSSVGCCHHDSSSSNVNKVNSTSSSPICQSSQDPILHQQLGLPTLHSQVHGFNPNYPQHLLQHNPSLASLMLLSSRYREIASGMANANKKPH